MGQTKVEKTKTSEAEILTTQELLNEVKALREQVKQLENGQTEYFMV